MTEGFAWVVGEFVLITSRGKHTQQMTVSGYSKISNIDSETQRELLYETAIQHARSKYLYSIGHNSKDEVDYAITSYGFKKVEKTREGFNKPSASKKYITKKAQRRIQKEVLVKADNYREENDKMITPKQKEKMYPQKKEIRAKDKTDYEEYLRLKKKFEKYDTNK